VAQNLKTIYRAATAEEAEQALVEFAVQRDQRYPTIAAIWRRNWQRVDPVQVRSVVARIASAQFLMSLLARDTRNEETQYHLAGRAWVPSILLMAYTIRPGFWLACDSCRSLLRCQPIGNCYTAVAGIAIWFLCLYLNQWKIRINSGEPSGVANSCAP
jgi:hypothetical protein